VLCRLLAAARDQLLAGDSVIGHDSNETSTPDAASHARRKHFPFEIEANCEPQRM